METMGTLSLKIKRLEKHLSLLEQRQKLSENFPDYHAKIKEKSVKTKQLLQQLISRKQRLQMLQ